MHGALGKKSYFDTLNLENTRMKFRMESEMLLTFSMKFQSDANNKTQLWKCWEKGCSKLDSQAHVLATQT